MLWETEEKALLLPSSSAGKPVTTAVRMGFAPCELTSWRSVFSVAISRRGGL